MKFIPRTEAPSETNKFYLKTTKGGYNKCIQIKSNGCVLPNCVGYAWGRFCESQNITDCKLSRGNAENWFLNTSDGYKRGQTPKLGAIICWSKGKTQYEPDGAGHVAFVEQINKDRSILISESGYNSFFFRTRTLKPPYELGGTYKFQGFIYPDVEFEEGEEMEFKEGDYVYAKEDVKLYTSIDYKNNTYTIKKNEKAYIRYTKNNNIALANPDTKEYFSSAWTNELDKFTKDEPSVNYKALYEEAQVKIKSLEEKINKAISDLS